jgi:pimeloyl-ACP methyl ester carboxylesterase
MKRPLTRILAILLLLPTLTAWADPVTLSVREGVIANGNYLKGDADSPAMLLMHGFLQTHHFHTIHHLSEGLHAEGFTVLAPTLSLNIPLRRQSLPCEAIHTHTLEDSFTELDQWIDWLQQNGHSSIVLVGHSTGSMRLLAYLASRNNPAIKRFIGISIVEARLELDQAQQQALRGKLSDMIARGDRGIVRQQFSFCKQLHATARSLLSYMAWTPEQILNTIVSIDNTPLVFIMGSKDQRLGRHWVQRLQATGKPVHIIEGANHFIDGGHEFELLDLLLKELQ